MTSAKASSAGGSPNPDVPAGSGRLPSEERGPGRPRDLRRTKAILAAAYRLLVRDGLDGVTSAAIASEAGVSTATLYRWWPSKEAILMDAYLAAVARRGRAQRAQEERKQGRRLRAIDRLRAQLVSTAQAFGGREGRVMRSLLVCIQQSTDLRQVFLERLIEPRRELDRELVREAVEEGDLARSVDPDRLLDALFGPLYFRLLIGHGPLKSAFAAEHFEETLRGAASDRQGRRRS